VSTLRSIRTAVALVCAAAVVGCSAQQALEPADPGRIPPIPAGAKIVTAAPSAASDESCNPTASLRPSPGITPGLMPAGSTMAKIAARGRLIVGVDQNTFLFGFRNPKTGLLEGFDIDIAREMARDILGDPAKIQFQALTSAQRIPALQSGQVDLVVRSMTITCKRLQEVAFSTVYFQANQRILARTNSGIREASDLGAKKACATTGSTSITTMMALRSPPTVYGVADWTDCLVMLQQGQVDAVSTDDSILAGLQEQDPYLRVVGPSMSPEPYGIGVNRDTPDLVRFVNGVLDRLRADGTWQRIYTRWLSGLGAAAAPPPASYRY